MNVPSHKEWRREVQKNVMEREKEEGGTSGGLGSSYKGRAPLPFFKLPQALRNIGPKGPKSPKHTLKYLTTDVRFPKKP